MQQFCCPALVAGDEEVRWQYETPTTSIASTLCAARMCIHSFNEPPRLLFQPVTDLVPGAKPGNAKRGSSDYPAIFFPRQVLQNALYEFCDARYQQEIHVLTFHQMISDIQLLLDCVERGQHVSQVFGPLRIGSSKKVSLNVVNKAQINKIAQTIP